MRTRNFSPRRSGPNWIGMALTHVVEHRDAAWRLHDSAEAVASDPWQSAGQAAFRRRALLRTVMAIHTRSVVARGRLRTPRGRRGIVLPPLQVG
jgi:hypothetical protein